MRYPKATMRAGGTKMMTVNVRFHICLWDIAGILAHDIYDVEDLPKTRMEAWRKVMYNLEGGRSLVGVWDNVDDEVEKVAMELAAKLFPELK